MLRTGEPGCQGIMSRFLLSLVFVWHCIFILLIICLIVYVYVIIYLFDILFLLYLLFVWYYIFILLIVCLAYFIVYFATKIRNISHITPQIEYMFNRSGPVNSTLVADTSVVSHTPRFRRHQQGTDRWCMNRWKEDNEISNNGFWSGDQDPSDPAPRPHLTVVDSTHSTQAQKFLCSGWNSFTKLDQSVEHGQTFPFHHRNLENSCRMVLCAHLSENVRTNYGIRRHQIAAKQDKFKQSR